MRQLLVGSILLSTALSGSAVTLGRYSGAAVIGRGLDIRVQALVNSGEDPTALCIRSEVFYGDAQVSSSSVRTTIQRSTPDAEPSVRIQSFTAIDEPIVSVVVRAGCATPFERRYVLLADPLSERATASTTGSPAQVPSVALRLENAAGGEEGGQQAARAGASGVAASGAASQGKAGGNVESAELGSAPKVNKAPSQTKAASRAKPASVVRKPEPEPAVPRLQLDPVDLSLSVERDPVLKLSLSLLSEPATSDEQRAAASALWKAINASPEEILRDNQKLSVLEAEAKGLREQEAKNKAALEAMQAQLETSRYMTWLAYLLGAMLLLALLAFAIYARRRKSADVAPTKSAWWAGADAPGKGAPAGKSVLPARTNPSGVDIDLDLGRDSSFDGYRSLLDSSSDLDSMPADRETNRRDNPMSQIGVSRSVATEELFDVQQQADFFVSLGETEKAIGVLKNHVAESQEPSALAYLDLFKLYHQLGRRHEYDQLREEFNQQFNAGAPPFDQYSDESRGLESYEAAFSRIQALWPQPRVLDVIEQSIFREPGDAEGEVFDLEAYRELLLLHAVAKEMIKKDMAEKGPQADFQHTAIRPLKAASLTSPSEQRVTQPLDEIPPASPRLGLDVDLDELSEISAFEASLPEVAVPVEPTSKPAPGRNAPHEEGNLIDFEVLDFMPPDDGQDPTKKDS